jgi:ATP-dependent exoDNAse (exonuclease V) alpha subunit
MAIFKMQIEPIHRSPQRSAPGAAAYRAGEKIRDERTGKLHNHSRRQDVTHKEIMLPAHLSAADMSWAKDRASLWNAAEYAEARQSARVAREIMVVLPAELSAASRLKAARTFSQEVADHYSVAVDLAIHDPRPSGDPRNFHAHLLLTTREVTANGLGAKTGLDLDTRQRVKLGLPNDSQEYTAIRARWATILNEALREANLDVRVDHRSLAAQGVDREPTPYIPFAAFKLEKAGKQSELAEEIRARYEERLAARQAPKPEHGPADASEQATPSQPSLTTPPAPKSLADIRREARENWLRMRTESTAAPKLADDPKNSRGSDDDHTR